MTLQEFNHLDRVKQTVVIMKYGAVIGQLMEGSYKVMLFQIDSFYAEVWYNKLGQIRSVRSFASTDQLTPYLHQIDIKELLP